MGSYVHPVLIKGKELQDLECISHMKNQKIFVYVDFVKSGRHFYSVREKQDYYLHRAIVRNRDEDIPHFHKKLNFKKKDFRFEDSVFSDFEENNVSAFLKDQEYWKINKFLRNEKDQNDVSNYLKHNYLQL